jgi:hypothetical protein
VVAVSSGVRSLAAGSRLMEFSCVQYDLFVLSMVAPIDALESAPSASPSLASHSSISFHWWLPDAMR